MRMCSESADLVVRIERARLLHAFDRPAAGPDHAPMFSAEEIIAALGLVPHPAEGGRFAETWRSAETLADSCLPARYGGPRSLGTAIYYLLETASFSAIHR